MQHKSPHERPVIGITMGDYNGIGTEVLLKALDNNRILKICTPVLYGSMKIVARYRKLLDLKDWFINTIPSIDQITHKKTNLVTTWDTKQVEIQPGSPTEDSGKFAFLALQKATEDLKNGFLDAVVTAPINKHNIQQEGFRFAGHTEYFTEQFGQQDSLMFLVSERIRVGVVTGHIPHQEVARQLSAERISRKLQLMLQSLRQDFGIARPKVAVLGLNPHAGEDGLLGTEEQQIIRPVIVDFKKQGHLVYGPFPADGFFASHDYRRYDAVLAMYHDQGLIPFKMMAFDDGVNFTAGLPVVRTSPDHGTAYDIAGKGIADEGSMLAAIFAAVDIVRSREQLSTTDTHSDE
jgi:4-hydroxythreonine-4-phosphate dehydrogenase